MDKIKRFVECTIPISQCNLHCSYCYVIQENRRNTEVNQFRCTPEEIGRAFSPNRWGGLMLVNLCAFGETLLLKTLPDITYEILKQGHYVNITNNGTITERIKQFTAFPPEMRNRLCFAFSLHYIELKKRGLLQTFSDNVHMVHEAGCSFLVQLNLCDEYIECIDEIKEFCLKEFGAYPQVALTRREGKGYSIFTSYSDSEYIEYAKTFDSPLFDFTLKNFKVKRKEFCYAGDWSFKLDLATGNLRSCYFSPPFYNIYDNINEPIKKSIVGNNCGNSYCVNSSHFMSLGIIPSVDCPSYVALRDRNQTWYQEEMREFLSGKLSDNNKQYNAFEQKMINYKFIWQYRLKKKLRSLPKRIIKKMIRLLGFNS